VQLPLAKGDAVFFNPAVFHAAGRNRSSDVRRMVNLLQVSSAFGRSMESVDRRRVVTAIYPSLLRRHQEAHDRASDLLAGLASLRGAGIDPRLANAIAAAAEGYSFPTDLDLDPPVDGLAPASQADLVREALSARSEPDQLSARLHEHTDRRR
jgi:ectoine hydroxylase-related dioxygenase (phytanoyl-CoA dioxygenase family)